MGWGQKGAEEGIKMRERWGEDWGSEYIGRGERESG